MSKSLEFCRHAAADKQRSSYSDRDWSKAVEVDSVTVFDKFIEGERDLKVTGWLDGDRVDLNLTLIFDPDADFQYFASAESKHDGTLLFIHELYEKLVSRVCCLETWYTNLRSPRNGDNVRFTVGNFVMLNEYGQKLATEKKPWLHQRTTILLPLKAELLE